MSGIAIYIAEYHGPTGMLVYGFGESSEDAMGMARSRMAGAGARSPCGLIRCQAILDNCR